MIFPTAPVITAPANTCASAFTLPTVATVAGFNVQYSIDGGAYSASPTTTTPGCHTITARYVLAAACGSTAAGTAGSGACGPSNSVSVVIFPTAPVITAPANTCASAFTLPTVATVAGFNVQYSIDGGAYSASPTTTTPGCHTITARYVLAAACGSTAAGTAGSGACGPSNGLSVVIFPVAPTAPNVNSGCGPIAVTSSCKCCRFNIQYSFDDGAIGVQILRPTADNCVGYKIKTRYVTPLRAVPRLLARQVRSPACSESPATPRKVDNTKPSVTCPPAQEFCQIPVVITAIPLLIHK